jgi:hypothetical protein
MRAVVAMNCNDELVKLVIVQVPIYVAMVLAIIVAWRAGRPKD